MQVIRFLKVSTLWAGTAALALGACAPVEQGRGLEPGVFAPTKDGPDGAPEGSCWGRTVTPAVVERVQERVEVKPARVNPDGTIAELPQYRTEDRQVIVTPRRDNWFETPCTDVLTPDFVASLQRALAARGLYAGEINGVLDTPTRSAVQLYQRGEGGPDSPVLSLKGAQGLGLIVVPIAPEA